MSLQTLRLKVTPAGGGAPTIKTLAEWGVVGGNLRLASGGADELQLQFARNYDEAAVFTNWAVLELFDKTNIRRFYGKVYRPLQSHRGPNRRHTATAPGPHAWMQRCTFVQPWMFLTEAEAGAPQAANDISSIVLHRADGENRKSLENQLEEILIHAIDAGTPVDYAFDNFPAIFLAEQKDALVSDWELFTRQMAFAPHVTPLWDYTEAVPTLRFASSNAGVIAGPWTPKIIRPEQLEGEEITPRDDLLWKQVKVCYVQKHSISVDGIVKTGRTVVEQTSDAEIGQDGYDAFGSAIVTIELRGVSVDSGEVTVPPEEIPPGNLAETIHEAFLHLWHEFKFTVPGEELDWSWAIGQEVTVLGHHADVNAARAMVIGLNYDLASKRTVAHCGPPGRLAYASATEILRPFRNCGGNFDPKDDPEEAEEPGGEATTASQFLIWIIEAGALSRFRLTGERDDP